MVEGPAALTPAYRYRATARRVKDGDSFVADVDLGFYAALAVHVRLRGVNAPEMVGETADAGTAAREFLRGLVTVEVLAHTDVIPLAVRKPLLLESYKDRRSFERWVCDVWVEDDGAIASVGDIMVKAGHAVRV